MANVSRFMKKRSVLFTWGICYASLLLLLLVFFSLLTSGAAQRRLADEYKQLTNSVQTKAVLRLDEFLMEAERRTINVATDLNVIEFARFASIDRADYYNVVPIQKMLRNQLLSTQNGTELCVNFYNIGKVLSNRTIYEQDTFYQTLASEGGLAVETVEALLTAPPYYRKLLPLTAGDGTCSTILTLCSVPIADPNPKALVIQRLNITSLDAIMESFAVLDNSAFLLTDERGNILRSAGNAEICRTLGNGPLIVNGEEMQIQDQPFWVSQAPMDEGGWQFVTLVPAATIVGRTQWLVHQAIPILAIVLAIGFVLSIIMIRMNYRPIKELKRQLPPHSQGGKGNEYMLIGDAFQDMRDGLADMRNLSEHQAQQIRDQFLKSLLFNSTRFDTHTAAEMMNNFGMRFHGDLFRVLMVDMPNEPSEEYDTVWRALDHALSPFFAETAGGMHAFPIHFSDVYAILLNFQEDASTEQTLPLQYAMERFNADNPEYGLSLFISGIYGEIGQIDLAWMEVREQADNLTVEMPSAEESGTSAPPAGILVFPHYQEELLLRYVSAGNSVEAIKVLEAVFDRNIREQALSSPLFRCLCFDILTSILKGVASPRRPMYDLAQEVEATSRLLRKQDSRKVMKETVFAFVARVCAAQDILLDASAKSHSLPVEQIIVCVEAHFCEHDFNVSRAADYLHVNVAYLSKYFKQQTGVGLLSYISGVRINYAKELMSQGQITVSQAANQAGFENLNTFIRLFKKYEGKTPGLFINES